MNNKTLRKQEKRNVVCCSTKLIRLCSSVVFIRRCDINVCLFFVTERLRRASFAEWRNRHGARRSAPRRQQQSGLRSKKGNKLILIVTLTFSPRRRSDHEYSLHVTLKHLFCLLHIASNSHINYAVRLRILNT